MKCSHCGEPASSHQLERSFGLPDAVFALKGEERVRRAGGSTDLYVLDKKQFFIRGVLYLPVTDSERKFGIGFWAEVDRDVAVWYADHYEEDLAAEQKAAGLLANDFPAIGETLRLPVVINWGNKTSRPTFVVAGVGAQSRLYMEQQRGITMARLHELLELPS